MAVTAKTSKSSPSHPPYFQMITEAITSLKERTGSSHYAIAKHIEEEQKIKDLPVNFKKLLSNQLKKNVASGKLIMVKKSFKMPPKSATTTATKVAKPKAVEIKAKKPAAAAVAVATKVVKAKAVAAVKSKKSLKVVKSPMKKKAKAVAAKAKKPKSIKSPVKKVATAAKKAAAKK